VRVTWLGHATALFELDGLRLLTDPVLRSRVGHLRRRVPAPDPDLARAIDAILVSHGHHDHFDRPSIGRVGGDPVIVGPASVTTHLGLRPSITLAAGESTELRGLAIEATHAEHDGRRWPFPSAPRDAIGFLIRGSKTILFAGDTDLFDAIGEVGAPVDVALIPVAGWGPKLGAGHLDPGSAAEAVRRLAPRIVIPIHWGTLTRIGTRGDDPLWRAAPLRFADELAALAPDVSVRVLEPGASLELDPA
jgi:L-ascorbate metabolism protein UlaG (beta-lactamase superfamily)